ncbi:MAG TPA: hypothetical protein VMH04_14000 [Candidatus Solibacter sp.]|nr:hypothetical protein [Candidatus Solibacter sp.]
MYVRRFVPFPVALAGLLLLAATLSSPAAAQVNGVPSSVTSPNFGGRAVNGTAPSVTSVGPRGYAPGYGVTFSTTTTTSTSTHHEHRGGDAHGGRNNDGHRDHHRVGDYFPSVIYAPIPYPVDMGATEDVNDDETDEYQGGPTIFDRRGLGEESYVPPVKDVRPRHVRSASDDTQADPPDAGNPQEPTLLVFRDGHSVEVGNYAIVGATLFDLTPGHSRKVAVADLDLDATQKQNDDRGVTFRLPAPMQAN